MKKKKLEITEVEARLLREILNVSADSTLEWNQNLKDTATPREYAQAMLAIDRLRMKLSS